MRCAGLRLSHHAGNGASHSTQRRGPDLLTDFGAVSAGALTTQFFKGYVENFEVNFYPISSQSDYNKALFSSKSWIWKGRTLFPSHHRQLNVRRIEAVTLHGEYRCAFSRIAGEDRSVVSGDSNPQTMAFSDEN